MKRYPAGFTLLEVMIAMLIISIIVGLIYGAFSGTADSKEEVEAGNDIYQQARWALDKMETDLSSSFVSKNKNSHSIFYSVTHQGANGLAADEMTFTTFDHVKYNQQARESDQAEVSYFIMENPETGVMTLYRREDPTRDDDPLPGGEFDELVDNVQAFDLRFYDGTEWVEEWDTRDYSQDTTTAETEVEDQEEGMVNTLPIAVEVRLLVAGPRDSQIAFMTKIRIVLSTIDLNIFDSEGGTEGTSSDSGSGKSDSGGTTGSTSSGTSSD